MRLLFYKWASLIAQLVQNTPTMQRRRFDSWVVKIPRRRDRLPTPVFLGFLCGSAGKKSTCNGGDLGLITELGGSSGEGKGYPFQYSGLENSMDSTVHGVRKSQTQLSEFHSLSSWYREGETPLHREIFFLNINFPYVRGTSTLFSELLLCLLFLKIISSK